MKTIAGLSGFLLFLQLLKKVGDKCIVRLPSKREVQVSAMCQATLGRVSNIDHNKQIKGKVS